MSREEQSLTAARSGGGVRSPCLARTDVVFFPTSIGFSLFLVYIKSDERDRPCLI